MTKRRMRKINHIHFIGIGGSGMCGIAEVMHNLGYQVSGSDITPSKTLERLTRLGIKVYFGHKPEHLIGAGVVVVSSAIDADNAEVAAAHAAAIPIVHRADMLGEIMRGKHAIAIAGAHGKTTTTSLLTTILQEAGHNPTYVIGGKLNASKTNAALGVGPWVVVEADESDASFLSLLPVNAIITNIDADHMQTYGNSFERLKDAYLKFLHKMPFYGLVVLNGDDVNLMEMTTAINRPFVTFGRGDHCDVRAIDIQTQGLGTRFVVVQEGYFDLEIVLNIPGIHNVYNALGAIAMARDEGVDDVIIAKAAAAFCGVGRRFEQKLHLVQQDILLIDDYGHHPAEVLATLEAARASLPNRRLVMLFQPHRYSRTRDCFLDFVEVLSGADILLLLDVYGAGELPISGATTPDLLAHLIPIMGREKVHYVTPDTLTHLLPNILMPGDLLITQGAGDVGALAQMLAHSSLYLGDANAVN